ncbi:uncharacterized protein LOC119688389 [Teleopsis dalmanni]|uniref:uncharacterized protein LOC119688389 n=1 Tax=Teleopsis dalmanni TaxID=139649 RepID=UPI0018CFC2E7|nr:uncharacterized protein LOC119688389 [Teleopsis dalmanni]
MEHSEYIHKKFHASKLKCMRSTEPVKAANHKSLENTSTTDSIKMPVKNSPNHPDEILQSVKKCPTNSFFRPWLDEPGKKKKRVSKKNSKAKNMPKYISVNRYHSNMVRAQPVKIHTAKEQERRDRNTLACLERRRAKRVEQALIKDRYIAFINEYIKMSGESYLKNVYYNDLMNWNRFNRQPHLFVFGDNRP